MQISVFGIGYVGAVTGACLADSGHQVIAIDTDMAKIQCLNQGRAPIVEKGLDALIAKNVSAGRLIATKDASHAIHATDISLICVGTPSKPDGTLDLQYVLQVCETIGRAIRHKKTRHIVVLRSTMLPGSAGTHCLPLLEQSSGKKARRDFGFGNNPEFLREGSAIADYYNPPKIVVGADDPQSADSIMNLYDGIDAPRIVTELAIAEGVKYADNAWHAMKVGFANEIGNIMKACGVDSHQVMDIFCKDQKLNISTAYLKPGFAFGGSCLPKDVNALRGLARANKLATPLFDALMDSNHSQVERAFDMVKATGGKKISILGLSFKAGTDDLRESPLVALSNKLLMAGYDIKIYDRNVNAHSYRQGAFSALAERIVTHADDIKRDADVFIIGNNGDEFTDILSGIANDDTPIIDLVRIGGVIEKRKGYHGICW